MVYAKKILFRGVFKKFAPFNFFVEPGQKSGNVRYVNARFVNKGDLNVRIYPDRGMKKDVGYLVGKRVSTLLEFVLKEGPLPYGMDFLVRQVRTNDQRYPYRVKFRRVKFRQTKFSAPT